MSQPLLSAAQIFDAADLKEDTVEVPEWGGSVRLVQMTAEESIEFNSKLETVGGASSGMYLMVIYCARDTEGNRLFSEDDLSRLKKKNINVLNRLQLVCLRLNGMGIPGEAALKKV